MLFGPLPASVAWRHHGAREGFESMFPTACDGGHCFEGHTAAVEDSVAWVVRYRIAVDERWITRTVRVWGWSHIGESEVSLDADGSGHWQVDGRPAPVLDGCLDVDLESSACTNLLAVRRMQLDVGKVAKVPAAYVRAGDLTVIRLEQTYARRHDEGTHQRLDYRAPAFDFEASLLIDESGLVLEYPGIASRVL
jgi:uncharacterized protein